MMSFWWRRLRSVEDGQAGATLTELLVSMIVFTVVLGVSGVAITTALKISRSTSARAADLSTAEAAVDDMSKLIQTAAQPPAISGGTPASAIISATANDLKFYGYNNPGAGPSIIEFSVSSGNLVESVTPVSNSAATICTPPFTYGTARTRILASGVGTSPTIFSYATQPATPVASGSPLPLAGSPASLSAANAANVEIVNISLAVNQFTNPGITATTATTTVGLPNALVATSTLPGTSC